MIILLMPLTRLITLARLGTYTTLIHHAPPTTSDGEYTATRSIGSRGRREWPTAFRDPARLFRSHRFTHRRLLSINLILLCRFLELLITLTPVILLTSFSRHRVGCLQGYLLTQQLKLSLQCLGTVNDRPMVLARHHPLDKS